MARAVLLVLLGLAPMVSACATSTSPRCARAGPSGSDRVTGRELLATGASDLHAALRLARPHFLRSRAARKDAPVLYVDGVRVGDLSYLRSLPVRDVAAVRALGRSDATTRFGTDHVGGALLVTTALGPPPPAPCAR